MRSAVSLILTLFFASAIGAQSGRRAAPTPTPIPSAASEEVLPYSESTPRTSRSNRPHDIIPVPPTTDGPPQTVGDTEVVKVETSLITIPVSVFDRNGLYIPGLKREDFAIFEDGKEQQVAYFGTQDKPFTVALLLDCSPSTRYKIEEIRAAAKSFIQMLGPNDSVMVIFFQQQVHIATKPTRDRNEIENGIDKARFDNGTSIYEAVDVALRKYLAKIEGRKAVVLFTDGVDTTSSKATFDGTVDYAEESDALVFPIYYDTFDANQDDPMAIGTSRDDYALGKRYLDDLADVTGGRVFRPETTPGGLTRAFEGIAEELRRQYNIGYVPDYEGKPGERKAIKVRVDRPNLVVRSRDSYIVGATPRIKPAPSK